jgi:aminopeptidase N
VPDGLAIDQQLRWQILCRLSALGAADRPEIDAEHANDRTAEGEEWSHQCRAALLDPAAKAASWEALINDDSLSNRQLSALATGFWQPGAAQAAITEPYVARYFAEIPEMAKRRTQSMAWQTAFLAFPAFAVSPATLDLAETMLARDDLKPSVRRVVVDFASVTRRLIAARALDAAALPA